MSVYTDLVAAGAVIDNHCSDLYTPDTPEARAVIHHHGKSCGMFASKIDGTPWLDVPFAYDPFWNARYRPKP